MARPIADTPILYGADAVRFEELIQETCKFNSEEYDKAMKAYKELTQEFDIDWSVLWQ